MAAFTKIGIPAAAGIVNFVVLTAALSSCNAGGLYSTSRMLRTAAVNADGPKMLARLSGRGVPTAAVIISAVVMSFLFRRLRLTTRGSPRFLSQFSDAKRCRSVSSCMAGS